MPERSEEEQHLAEADRHIAEGEARLARQRELIQHLTAGGHDTAQAEMLLASLVASLKAAREHRRLIVRRLGEARYDPGRSF